MKIKKLTCVVLPLVLACGVAILPGCSGGSSGFGSNQGNVSRFAGTYSGTFTGVIQPGLEDAGQTVTGTFTATADENGNITTLNRTMGAATDTFSRSGRVEVTATLPDGTTSTLSGKADNASGTTVSGSFTTKAGSTVLVKGTFVGSRLLPE